MRTITLRQMPHDLPHMFPGIEYVVEDTTAGSLLHRPGMVDAIGPGPVLPSAENPERVLVVRFGGIGDLLAMTPLFEVLAREGARVEVCCGAGMEQALLFSPHVVGGLPCPPTLEQVMSYERVLWCENSVENNPRAESLHMTDLFLELAGCAVDDPALDKSARVYEEGGARLRHRAPVEGHEVHVGFHVAASGLVRRYPAFPELLRLCFEKTNWHLHLYGAEGDYVQLPKHARIHNHSAGAEKLELREAFEHMASRIHVFCGVDSGLLWAAGAMRVPSLALFAAFPHDLRHRYHTTVHLAQGIKMPCAPCFHHGRLSKYPESQPCALAQRCVAFDDLTPFMAFRQLQAVVQEARKANV